jgi:hypothetical protein
MNGIIVNTSIEFMHYARGDQPASRLGPKKILRPKLDLKSSKFPKVCKFALRFSHIVARNYKIFVNFSECGPKTNLGWPPPH